MCDDFEPELVEFDNEDDPVHLLVNYPPKGGGVGPCEQPERRIQADDPQLAAHLVSYGTNCVLNPPSILEPPK